ncbi:MAG: uroporphyrinogen decarboxylase, partial [Clostridiales bacterium]|nr:uroporphyrinogen decarboxylase [Clostridiales bacterium]
LALHLRGNNIFMDMYDDAKYVKDLLAFCGKIAMKMSDMFIDAGMAVIAAVDPLISQISVDHFEEFMSPIYTEIFEHIRSKAVLSSFFVCGDATRNIEAMCETNPDSIFVDENVDLAAAKRITDKYNITIGGNLPLTTVMLHGTQQDNMKCVIDELDSIQDRHNLVIAPGCDMPYDTPIESTIGIVQAIYNEADVREMLKDYTNVEEEIEVELPNYEILKKPLIEVFTLDSATCAACTYMMGAAEAAKDYFGDEIDMMEYKYTVKENIARIKKMGVPNLPSMYINGELKYRSIIPSREELFKAIKEAKGSI